ncbi:hypothetical protein BC938DRAFT_476048 [Jimgerdemannia flammicorona]|uniref:Uncharacterized protein n=1 Tax=Jimgerdemannia flammicorona TaxID=994334 RepID=A0A433PKX7_9FUNG|nr:hypothetical protein BC938DRAFT_476048 [Jimgerdemannia flammicorona]
MVAVLVGVWWREKRGRGPYEEAARVGNGAQAVVAADEDLNNVVGQGRRSARRNDLGARQRDLAKGKESLDLSEDNFGEGRRYTSWL